ncbi:MAG: tetratricopeptide repeat protein [Planctomycetota bacterium]
MSRVPIMAFVIFAALLASSQDAEKAFKQGNAHYDKGAFEKAISAYETALASGENPGVAHFNIGNSLFRLGRFGEALYHYECAHLRLPREERIEKNAGITRKRLGLEPEEEPSFLVENLRALAFAFTPAEYVSMAALLGSLAFFLLAAFCLHRSSRILRWSFGILLSGLVFMVAAGIRSDPFTCPKGIVVKAVQALNEPSPFTGECSFFLREGEEVRVRESIEAWHKIENHEKRTGWVQASGVCILPSLGL